MMFDLPPAWFAAWARRGILRPSLRYRVPPMPFSLLAVAGGGPGQRWCRASGRCTICALPPGRGTVFNGILWSAQRIPLLDTVRPVLTLLEFG